jgi:tRNA nucleotidyltransferase (CCA-adding enzyme)
MAQAELHPVFNGLTGRIDGMVFRRLRGKTVIAQRPQTRAREISPAQAAQRERFALAREYARRVLADPWQRRMYDKLAQERNRRADLLLVSDYLTPPVVEDIDVSGYQRQPDGLIRILADDDIEVVMVDVTIETAAGVVVERGSAAKAHGVWCYRVTSVAPAEASLTMRITAWDRPGHTATKVLTFD